MSKTTPGSFRGFEFWVYDVCQGFLCFELANIVESMDPRTRPAWMDELLPTLQAYAVVNDMYLCLDEWASGHEEEFVELLAQARSRLADRETVTPEEASQWVFDGLPVHWRGTEPISTAPTVEFADALISIIRGAYPPAPPGRLWYFGAYSPDGDVATIGTGE